MCCVVPDGLIGTGGTGTDHIMRESGLPHNMNWRKKNESANKGGEIKLRKRETSNKNERKE